MSEECKDCIHIRNLEDKIRSLWHALNEVKDQNKNFEKRITELEIAKSENKKDFQQVFKSIKSIEDNLDKIASAIEKMQLKNAKKYESLSYEIIKYIVIAVVAAAVAKIF